MRWRHIPEKCAYPNLYDFRHRGNSKRCAALMRCSGFPICGRANWMRTRHSARSKPAEPASLPGGDYGAFSHGPNPYAAIGAAVAIPTLDTAHLHRRGFGAQWVAQTASFPLSRIGSIDDASVAILRDSALNTVPQSAPKSGRWYIREGQRSPLLPKSRFDASTSSAPTSHISACNQWRIAPTQRWGN